MHLYGKTVASNVDMLDSILIPDIKMSLLSQVWNHVASRVATTPP